MAGGEGSRRDNLSTGRVSTEKLGENILRMAGITTIQPYISLPIFVLPSNTLYYVTWTKVPPPMNTLAGFLYQYS